MGVAEATDTAVVGLEVTGATTCWWTHDTLGEILGTVNTIIDMLRRFLIRQCERIRALRRQSPALTQLSETETFAVFIGTVEGIEDGRRQVLFEGTKLAYRTYSQDDERICETLYESKGRLLVHTQTLHRVEGLRTEYELRELSEHELRTKFPGLSQLRFPLGLEETLNLKPIQGDREY